MSSSYFQQMDSHERLIVESENESCVAVVGRGEEFLLIPLGTQPAVREARVAEAHRRDFAYCGVLGVQRGRVALEIAPENPTAARPMCFASIAFAREVADRLLPTQHTGDSIEWLAALASLKDPRDTHKGAR